MYAEAAYTIGGAIAGGRTATEGSITVGKRADFVLLATDPFTATPAQLAAMVVEMTVAGGRVVHQRKR